MLGIIKGFVKGSNPISWILGNKVLLIAAGLAVIIVVVTIKTISAKFDYLQTENGRLRGDNAVLTQKITDQNAAIDTWKKEADARLAAAQFELLQAKAARAAAETRAKSISTAKPSTPGNDCKSTLDLLNGVSQ